MAISLPDARQLSDEVLEAPAPPCGARLRTGIHRSDIADLLGVSQETVSRWWTAYAAGGSAPSPAIGPGAPWAPGGRSRRSRPATSRT